MRKNHLTFYFILLVVFQFTAQFVMAQTDQPVIAYVTIQGAKQGNFKGGTTMRGREGQIGCVGFSYGIQSPRDPASGLATGKRQHFPVILIKHLDGASPQLFQAAFSNETLKSVVIEFSKMGADGRMTVFQTIRLTNANISKLNQFGGTSSPEKLIPDTNPYEEISLTFQKIQIENAESKTSASDDWSMNN